MNADLTWEPDILAGFEAAPLQQATLVRAQRVPGQPKGVILHVHGFNDYFFQDHLAEVLIDAGYVFYAVDLRAAGRSERPELIPHYVGNLREHAEDLAEASQVIRELHPDLPLVVHAHSTGGLTASLWAHAYRNAAGSKEGPDGLILNSPFFEIPGSVFARVGAAVTGPTLGRIRPMTALKPGPSIYATAQHVDQGGRWQFDRGLKRTDGLSTRLGWLRTVRLAQARVDRGLDIHAPVLLAVSGASSHNDPELLDSTDSVLDVRAIAARADKLGNDVTLSKIDGAVHDLALSDTEPRELYFAAIIDWLDHKLETR
ncbi:MAG: alpha/beta hydrolase [Promicromonosporaceae bacterium]|nr:alpha/beta hydrolase [Promicromonosporaceae bacterium]